MIFIDIRFSLPLFSFSRQLAPLLLGFQILSYVLLHRLCFLFFCAGNILPCWIWIIRLSGTRNISNDQFTDQFTETQSIHFFHVTRVINSDLCNGCSYHRPIKCHRISVRPIQLILAHKSSLYNNFDASSITQPSHQLFQLPMAICLSNSASRKQ